MPAGAGVQELWCDPRQRRDFAVGPGRATRSAGRGFFSGLDSVLRVLERNHVRPLHHRALGTAERWLLDRQEADGSWAGIQPPWVYALLALRALGYPLDHPVMQQGLAGFGNFTREQPLPGESGPDAPRMLWTEPCLSPVWDTCLAAIALQDAGLPGRPPRARPGRASGCCKSRSLAAAIGRSRTPTRPPAAGPSSSTTTSIPTSMTRRSC